MRFIFASESTTHPSIAVAPPDSPLPAPLATTGTTCLVAQRIVAWTSANIAGKDNAQRPPGFDQPRLVAAIRLDGITIGDHARFGQLRPQLIDSVHGNQASGSRSDR